MQNKTVVVPNNVPQHFYTDICIFFVFKASFNHHETEVRDT